MLFGDLAFPRMRKSKLEGKELFKLSLPLCKPQQRIAFVWTALLCASALTTIPVLRSTLLGVGEDVTADNLEALIEDLDNETSKYCIRFFRACYRLDL